MEHQDFIKNNPFNEELSEKYKDSGFMYFYKRDKRFRPVMIIDLPKLIQGSFCVIFLKDVEEEDFMAYTIMILEHVWKHGLIPGKVENWVVIVDWAELGLTELPISKVKTILSVMQKNYPGRLYKLFAINVGFMLKTIWTVISGFIDSFTEHKIQIYGDDYLADLFRCVDHANLEKKFWGLRENLEKDFFPPDFNEE